MKKIVVFFSAFFLLFVPVHAQETATIEVEEQQTTETTSTLKTDTIWEKARLDEEIATVKATYQTQLETYLYQDKLYRIAYDQRAELQTLVSIEDLTQKAKTLGVYRDDVLISYLDLLRLNLVATEGIELTLKAEYLSKLETTITYLENHQENLKNLNDRDQVSLSLTTFATDQKSVQKLAEGTLVLLSVGNLQMIYDKAVVLKDDIDLYLENEGTLSLPAIERASVETDSSLNSAKLKLDDFWNGLVEHDRTTWSVGFLYDSLPSTMNPTYVNLSQSLSYLDELLSI